MPRVTALLVRLTLASALATTGAVVAVPDTAQAAVTSTRSVQDPRGDLARQAAWKRSTPAERSRADVLRVVYAVGRGRVTVAVRLAVLGSARRSNQTFAAVGLMGSTTVSFLMSSTREVLFATTTSGGTYDTSCRGVRGTRSNARRTLTVSVPVACLPPGTTITRLSTSSQSTTTPRTGFGEAIAADRRTRRASLRVR